MQREQNGTIILRSGRWYVSYWERRNVNGTVERKRATHYLGDKTTRGKHPPADIAQAARTYMATFNANASAVKPEHIVSIVDFVDTIYMPWVGAQKRAATARGYQKIWSTHLKGHFGSRLLRDYQPHDATVFLTSLAAKGMGKNAVNNVRALMSGVFKHAAALGYVTTNPVHLAKVLVAPTAPKETPHYTLLEMAGALAVLEGQPKARLAMALAFIGLRPSEIAGLREEDVDPVAGKLHVRRSAWRGILNEGGKGKNSAREVTLGPTVIAILTEYRETHKSQRGFVLESDTGNPLNMDTLARYGIRPIFEASGLTWKGFYGGRRGAETEMNRYTNGNSQITSHHFGHTKAVADAHYIKPLPEETKVAALALDSAIGETKRRLETASETAIN